MDLDDRIVQLEKEKQETLEQHAKRPCVRGNTSSEEEDEEKVVEDTAASDEEEEEEETEDDTDSDSDSEYVPFTPRRLMTDEEIREHRRQVAESNGFDVDWFEGILPGSIKPYTLTEANRPPLIEFSKKALKVYNESNNTTFIFDKLIKSNAQCVAGTMFYITFGAQSGNTHGTFRARVWKKIMNEGSQKQNPKSPTISFQNQNPNPNSIFPLNDIDARSAFLSARRHHVHHCLSSRGVLLCSRCILLLTSRSAIVWSDVFFYPRCSETSALLRHFEIS
ncbi:hypothetical protein Ahy_A05g025482 [Arachis hypogaea]|uniref:Cystatin domain-containing protein n=1 Tax=Arachis hypogaea TaxID=3818 RepID=A0A445D8U1_ARAHY|nr:hypothetical protein Ahy_A05g025482 [Arachis hypogaea]